MAIRLLNGFQIIYITPSSLANQKTENWSFFTGKAAEG